MRFWLLLLVLRGPKQFGGVVLFTPSFSDFCSTVLFTAHSIGKTPSIDRREHRYARRKLDRTLSKVVTLALTLPNKTEPL
jgi:hypothetical protein